MTREQNSLPRSSAPIILTQFPNNKTLGPGGTLKPSAVRDGLSESYAKET